MKIEKVLGPVKSCVCDLSHILNLLNLCCSFRLDPKGSLSCITDLCILVCRDPQSVETWIPDPVKDLSIARVSD